MVDHNDLFHEAQDAIVESQTNPHPVRIRRAVSTLYYSFFHALIAHSTVVYGLGGVLLQNQVGRAFNHGAMRKVCEAYLRAQQHQFTPPLQGVAACPPAPPIIAMCDTFVILQDARQLADYDLASPITIDQAQDLLLRTTRARAALDSAAHLPETRVFLTALLLHDRWGRRG